MSIFTQARRTFWKFNCSLLRDIQYVKERNNTIENIISQALPYDRNNLTEICTSDIHFIADQLFLAVLLMEMRSKHLMHQ